MNKKLEALTKEIGKINTKKQGKTKPQVKKFSVIASDDENEGQQRATSNSAEYETSLA